MNTQSQRFDIHKIKAIIGLGNPGQAYSKTRHNIGFRVVDQIANQFGVEFNISDDRAFVHLKTDALNVYLVKPLTFMNNSGKAALILQKKGIKAEEILVIHDELEKPFGNISIKFGGSARGHNGLRSIIEFLGQDFWRLRFGIDRPVTKELVGSYVLAGFSQNEESQILHLIKKTIDLVFGNKLN